MALYLMSCVGVENDLPYLEHFIRHCEQLGIAPENFPFLLQTTNPDSPRLAEARKILEAHGITQDRLWSQPYSSRVMWEERRRLQQELAGSGDWVVLADMDELYTLSNVAVSKFLVQRNLCQERYR